MPHDAPQEKHMDEHAAGSWRPWRVLAALVLVLGVGEFLGYATLSELGRFPPILQLAAGEEAAQGGPAHTVADRPQGPLRNFDASNLQIDREKILSGGPPKDGIPALTDPHTLPARDAEGEPSERVFSVEVGGEARAYPVRILNWHEIVNDTLGEVPIAVIYCPLCDSASVVDRRVKGRTLEFGVSGLLYNSNVLLYDRQDDALWSQLGLVAVSGPHAGTELKHLGDWAMTTLEKFTERYPEGTVLSTRTGHRRAYGRNPYAAYFKTDRLMFPVEADLEGRRKKLRVMAVKHKGEAKAFALAAIRAAGERYEGEVAGERVVFAAEPEGGARVVEAPEGASVVHTFWFSWKAFHPETELVAE